MGRHCVGCHVVRSKIALTSLERAANLDSVLGSRTGVQRDKPRLAPPYLPLWSLFGRVVCFVSKVLVSTLGSWSWLSLHRVGK